ncbi:MAG: phosphopantothenoylcysteine decarboxylase [Leptospiraceae bacterium]|nr:phosphopantothenoylcysteine decarboxylase [Leptospiraceae bacterium]MDW7975205.1 phosphopantothenoylcysteine decarboxylase [Leptospiraceae bacterium]
MKAYRSQEFKLIVTSGPTREWIDPVRYISNPSSGRTGYELARIGKSLFREVVYIAGYTEKPYKEVPEVKNISVDTTESMAEAVFNELEDNTLLIMAAAPADYTPADVYTQKIKKSEEEVIIRLKPTIDILKTIGTEKQKNYQKLLLVGFAAETNHLEVYAKEKLEKKNIHFICANQVYKTHMGFGDNENTVYIFDRWNQTHKIGPLKKDKVCMEIFHYLNQRISEIFDKI